MSEQAACDCCKRSVEVVSASGLCFACETFHVLATAIKEDTRLSNEETLNLATGLSELILSALVERLQLPGHELSLLKDLLVTMEQTDKIH